MAESERLQPLLLVLPKSVSRADIRRAEKLSGICIIECVDPEKSRYSDVPPTANIDAQARAALDLLRMILTQQSPDFRRGDLTKFFVNALVYGKSPTPVTPTQAVTKK